MGLLDDAIREHLDLKRRRGADPSEIAREENEALGPVRRTEPTAQADAAANGDESFERPPADESLSAGGGSGAALDEPGEAYADDDFGYEPAPVADDHPLPDEPPRTHADPYAEREEESATPPHGDPLLHQPTREFSAFEVDEALGEEEPPAAEPEAEGETAPADRADGDDEDVLEETPDFLQETPEHDRLWFEQKPPKDFDF
ncbi:MAG TPA: hypothetical protein VK501_04560 [Baekduia sp.]|uniref:hypothetical protein n=1 Tax=Baekduia sp. TaxID=2600305 RepID=UPI002C72C572|nr:hypothetical protein [Baekduia sp.]HMJ33169.1 hypothetical protein [Baekduia sp.]